MRLKRTARDNQLEPRWEDPYRVKKMARRGQCAWIEEIHGGEVKGKYHVNALAFYLDGKNVGRTDERWTSVAANGRRLQRSSDLLDDLLGWVPVALVVRGGANVRVVSVVVTVAGDWSADSR